MEEFLDKIKKLRPVTFEWDEAARKEFGFKDEMQTGLIAQEVEKVFPELVVNNNQNGYKSVHYDWLPIYLLRAIQQLLEIVDKLQKEVDELKTK